MSDISDATGMNRRDDMGSMDCVDCMCGKGDRDSKDSRNRSNVSPDNQQVSAEPRISGQHAPAGSKLVFIDIDGVVLKGGKPFEWSKQAIQVIARLRLGHYPRRIYGLKRQLLKIIYCFNKIQKYYDFKMLNMKI